jgi:hypothetical protein
MTEAYSVFVKISAMDNEIRRTLSRLSEQFKKLQEQANNLFFTFSRINNTMISGEMKAANAIMRTNKAIAERANLEISSIQRINRAVREGELQREAALKRSIIIQERVGKGSSESRLAGASEKATGGLVGGGLAMAGFWALSKALNPGFEYQHQIALMKAQGMNDSQISQSVQAVRNSSFSVPTSDYAESLATIREARMVFTGKDQTQEAIQFMPILEKINYALNSFTGGRAGDQSYDLAKALEIRGATKSTAMFQEQADLMAKAIIASGGKIGASDFQGTFKFGKTATSDWSDAFAYTILPTLIQEMKGKSGGGAGGPGAPLMSMYQAIVGGTMSNKGAEEFLKLGLINTNDVIYTKTGNVKGLRPGAIKGSSEFQSDPYQWTQNFLVPALIAAGYNTPDKMKAEIAHLFSNRNAQFVATQFSTQQFKFDKDRELIKQAAGISSYGGLSKNDPLFAMTALSKQWHNVLSQLGKAMSPQLIWMTKKLTIGLSELAVWMGKHQTAVKYLIDTIAVLLGAAVLGGLISAFGYIIAPIMELGEGLMALYRGTAFLLGRFGMPTFVKVMAGVTAGIGAFGAACVGLGKLLGEMVVYIRDKVSGLLGKISGSLFGKSNDNNVQLVVEMDGIKVGKIVSKAQAKAANSPNTSISGANALQSLLHPAFITNGNS